jgi:hypothetical protein
MPRTAVSIDGYAVISTTVGAGSRSSRRGKSDTPS